jgi:LytS/YehU family sensor histidine kinase
MVTRISELLRRILAESPAATVPLAHELELLERYVGIQELRFPSRLSHAFEVPEAAARARVPSLVVQPLVENAVLHGLAGHDGPVEVRLEATVADDLLTVVVTNPGGPAGRGAGGAGLGLRNVAERLATLYGARASVRLECPTAGRFRATLVVPQDADAMRTAAA